MSRRSDSIRFDSRASLSSGQRPEQSRPDPPEASGPSAVPFRLVPLLAKPLISQQPRAGRDDNGPLISSIRSMGQTLANFQSCPLTFLGVAWMWHTYLIEQPRMKR